MHVTAMSPDLEAPDADIISSAVSSRPQKMKNRAGEGWVIRLIATIVEREAVVVWWAGLNG